MRVGLLTTVCAVVPLDDLKQLLQQAIGILQTEATVVDLPAPCKVFGDIHGQFTDLKKFFATYGTSFRWCLQYSCLAAISYGI